MKKVLQITRFDGGMSVAAEKMGPPGSFLYSRSIDFRKKPNQFSILPAPTDISSGVVTDLIQDIVQAADGSRYALGDTGNFYKINTSNVVTEIGDCGTGGAGLLYRQDLDTIYITSSKTASKYYPVSGSPTAAALTVDKYTTSASVSTTAVRSGGVLTYLLPNALSEATTNRCNFTPDIEPLYSIKVTATAVGTGNWTVTVHDDANNVMGTVTINNGSLVVGQNEFILSTPARMLVNPNARTYHFHLVSSTGDGQVAAATTNDLSTADFQMLASRFVLPNNGLHPAIGFLQYNCFGNERYLSVWEPLSDSPSNLEWLRHRLTFPPGYEVCGLALYNEFLAIACEKRSTSATREYQEGKIFFWDGSATTYNNFVDVPEGSPYSLFQYKNVLYWLAGGAWFGYSGGQPAKLKTFPNTDVEFSSAASYIVGYPHVATVRKGVLLTAFPSETNIQTIEHGAYSWGAVDKNYPNSFGYSYPISTGTRLNNGTNNLRIGAVKSFGDTLYMSWRDDQNPNSSNKYGLDMVNNSSNPYALAPFESLIFDNNQVWKLKSALTIFGVFKSLPAGASVFLKYKLDRSANWTYVDVAKTSGTFYKYTIGGTGFYEAQIGADLAATTATPEVLLLGLEYDDGAQEQTILSVT